MNIRYPLHVYVAGPYRGNEEHNMLMAGLMAARLFELHHVAICPHVLTWQASNAVDLSDDVWLDLTQAMLHRCDAMVVFGDWLRSTGTLAELASANEWSIPVYSPEELTPGQAAYVQANEYEVFDPSSDRMEIREDGWAIVESPLAQDNQFAYNGLISNTVDRARASIRQSIGLAYSFDPNLHKTLGFIPSDNQKVNSI